jgi:hypothetical protein
MKWFSNAVYLHAVFRRCLSLVALGCLCASAVHGQSHWEVKPSNAAASLSAVIFGNGLFVAVGDNGTIVTSPDGEVWTARVSGTSDRLRAITYGSGHFVATKENRSQPILTSPDGINWNPATVIGMNGAPAESGAWQQIAFAAGRFLAIGPSQSSFTDVLISEDGLSFKAVVPAKYPAPDGLTGPIDTLIVFRNQIFGISGRALTTTDGATWKPAVSMWAAKLFASDSVSKIAILWENYFGGTFSIDGGATFFSSNALVNRYGPTGIPRAACYGAGRFIAVDSLGATWSSERGEYWTPGKRLAQNGEEFRAVAFDGTSRFVAIGSAPTGGSALIAATTADPLPVPPGYTIYSLKEMTNGVFDGQAGTISNTGIIGGSILGPNKSTLGAILRDGVVTTYPDPVYHSYSTVVTSVNDDGSAALNVNLSYPLTVGIALPQESRTFPGGGIYSTAASINANGWITGSYRTYNASTKGIYRYNANTDERIDLGNLGLGGPDGSFFTSPDATSINEWGDIAGRYVTGYLNGYAVVDAFRLSANGQLVLIPLPGAGNRYAENIVINSHGDVAGSTDLASQGRAFLFRDGVTSDIDVLNSGGSSVWGMNNNSDVVGYFRPVNKPRFQSLEGCAFLYRDGAMFDLNRLLDGTGDGWVLRQATAINDNGWIVGEGYRHGFYREPFLAIPNGGKPAQPPTRFVNLSTRLRTGTGDDALIAGFVLRGGAKKLVIRAIGPGLANPYNPSLSVPNPLADPTLQLFNERGEQIAFNDNFTDYPVFPVQNEIGAYGLEPPYSWPVIRDSVIMATLPEGSYTAVVRGKDGSSGNCLVEVYNIDSDYTPGLVNIATRGPVGTGDDVMIAGFVIRGDRERRVLVRGIGPSLAAAGVANPLGDPTLEIHDANGQIAQNDNWKSDQENEIRAAGFAPADDRDAAVILSLWPGSYTAIVRGKGSDVGNAIVEVYTLPD